MKIHNVLQGTPEWLALRMGKITGTDIDAFCLEPRKVTLTVPQIQNVLDKHGIAYKKAAAKDALIELLPDPLEFVELSSAAQTLILQKIHDMSPKDPWQLAEEASDEKKLSSLPAIQRGKALEPAARAFYQRRHGVTITEVGMITNDEETAGMSPDGLIYIGETLVRGLEIKCPDRRTHMRWLRGGKLPNEHVYQCEMGLAISGLDEWDFLSFCPGQAPVEHTLVRSSTTERLVEGLRVLAEEMEIMADELADQWDAVYSTEDGNALLCYWNGNPMFGPNGEFLTEAGDVIVPNQEVIIK